MIPTALLLLLAGPEALGDGMHRMDAPLPPRPLALTDGPVVSERDLGTPTTLFVNFDGVELTECNPSNSKSNCHWYNFEDPIPAFSGSTQTKVSVLQAMRRDTDEYGIRITGLRPPSSEDYTMVIYGGTEQKYGALGSAPAGDCDDQKPNQIAFAHIDGDLVDWINGGATTALHEAAHSWGLDHIDTDRSIMYPSGDNQPTAFRGECVQVVRNVDLDPGTAECPELNAAQCGAEDLQDARARLERMFGGPYVDVLAPTVELVEPADGQYFQAPANFDVVLDISDDLHPQVYDATFWLNDDPKPSSPRPFIDDRFAVTELPVGTWAFHVELIDEAGNATRLDFEIEVGEDPPPEPMDDRGCAVARAPGGGSGRGVSGPLALVVMLLSVARRRGSR